MPLYELVLILRPMPKKEVLDCLRRTADNIWSRNGVLRKIEYLGPSKLPFKKPIPSEEGKRYTDGNYFIYHLSIRSSQVFHMRPELKLDLDIINSRFNLTDFRSIPEDYECTLEEELKPPALRKSVQPLLDEKNVRADVRR